MGGAPSKWDYENRNISELKQTRSELSEIYKFERDPKIKESLMEQIKAINAQIYVKQEGAGAAGTAHKTGGRTLYTPTKEAMAATAASTAEHDTADHVDHGLAHREAKRILHRGLFNARRELFDEGCTPEQMADLENSHKIMDHVVDKILIPSP